MNATNAAWFYRIGDQQLGPVEADHLRHLISSGQVGQGVPVWRDGFVGWTPAAQVPQLRPAGDAMRFIVPTAQTSGSALAAGYLGLFSIFFPPLAVAALIAGIIGIRDLKRNPYKNGWGRAITGIVLGGLVTALMLVVLALALFER